MHHHHVRVPKPEGMDGSLGWVHEIRLHSHWDEAAFHAVHPEDHAVHPEDPPLDWHYHCEDFRLKGKECPFSEYDEKLDRKMTWTPWK